MTAAGLALAAAGLLLANAFFVAVEFSHLASRRSALEARAEGGDRRARRALGFTTNLDLRLAGSQLGVTMASLGLGAVVARIAGGPVAVAALAVVVFLHMVVGVLAPKSVAVAEPERVLLRLYVPNAVYLFVFGPVVRALNGLAGLVARALGVRARDRVARGHNAAELSRLLADAREGGFLEEASHSLLAGALDLGGRDLTSVLVPADRVVAVPSWTTVAEAERAVVESGVSRLLVHDADRRVVGFVHAKDLLTVPAVARHQPIPRPSIRLIPVLDAATPLDVVLVAMRRMRTHVAAVIDEERRFTGIATLEDVLDSIVRDI